MPHDARPRRRLVLAALLPAAALAACASPAEAAPPYGDALIAGVPHVRQKPDYCGEACVAMALNAAGIAVDQDWVFDKTGVDPALSRGAWTRELKRGLEAIGYAPGPVWHEVPANDPAALEALFAELHADLLAGVPSIICTRYDARPDTTEHFRLILGYDAAADAVVYHEPAEDAGAYRKMPRAQFLSLWPLKYENDKWTVIRLRLAPTARLPVPATSTTAPAPAHAAPAPAPAAAAAPTFTDADFAAHVQALTARLPEGFTVVVEPPFVVAGDESPELVRRRARSTVRWAVDHLKRQFFARDPTRILDIFLFKDEDSYRGHATSLFGHTPDTPYGYYSPSARALIMNIGTGGGTLVHEIVHPFVAANFEEAPSWLNEGLGSLYEQSSERDGKIVGLTNWRLAGLQRAIRAGRVPRLQALTATTERQFYDHDPGTNYSQARYLMYYLQEQGLLERYYHAFHAARAADPTGYRTLCAVLGLAPEAMDAFQQRWERWVLTLEFP